MAPTAVPQPVAPQREITAQVTAPTPPYLASQTAMRMGRPTDPFAGGLRAVLLIFGVLLAAGFVAPVTFKPEMHFHWEHLFDPPLKYLIVTFVWLGAAALGIVFGAIPMPSTGRAAIGAALGLVALVYPVLALHEGDFVWQTPVLVVGMVLAPTGLLIRDAYRDAALGRIVATIGALAIIAVHVIPSHGQIPLTDHFIKAITDGEGWQAKVYGAIALLPFALAVLSLLAWLPGPGGAGAKLFAWMFILVSVIDHFAHVIIPGHIGAQLKASPYGVFFAAPPDPDAGAAAAFMPDGVILTAYLAFAAYGLATLLGKNLERR